MKKKAEILIVFFIGASFLYNCYQEKALSESEFEKAVFYEIFPAIIDSTYHDLRLIAPPPPPPDFLEKRGYDVKSDFKKAYVDWEKSNEYKENKMDWEKRRYSIQKDTASIFLSIPDSIYHFENEDMLELIKHFKDQNLSIDSKNIHFEKGFEVDLTKLKTHNEKIKFKYQSEFPKGREFWMTKYDFNFNGAIGFSRILFDKNKSFGVVNISNVRERLNGAGYRVFIKKHKNGKWEIDKIKGTWIS